MKKKIPLELLTPIEKILSNNLDIITYKNEENCYYSLIDKDQTSNFYFKIYILGSKIIGNYRAGNYVYKWKPANKQTLNQAVYQGKIEDITNQLNEWILFVREYNNSKSIYDDPFIETYTNNFYADFKIIDEDADYAPFNPEQQEYIESFLKYLETHIQSDKLLLESNKTEEIISEIRELEQTIHISTKNQVIRKLSRISAKIYKYSKSLAKDLVKKVKDEVLKQVIQSGIKHLPDIIDAIHKI